MADATELEAELLAALGMSQPGLSGLATTEADTPKRPAQRELQGQQPAQETPSDPLPAPSVPPSLLTPPSPAPTAPALPPPAASRATPTSTPIPGTASIQTPTPLAPASAPDTTVTATSSLPAPVSSIPEPPLVPEPNFTAQSLAQGLAASTTDLAPQQPSPPAPVPASSDVNGARSPKRPRSPDGLDEANSKRQKTDETGPNSAIITGAPGLDLAAMLNDALASLDQHTDPTGGNIIMQDADVAQPAAPVSPTLEAERAENKFMKASSNPFYVMRSMSLPVLGNIAVQILLRLSQQARAETETLLGDPDSEFRKAYDMLRDMFRATRRAFSDSPLLSADELEIADSEDRETLRMSNLAATAASAFGAHDVPCQDVHDAFFSIFIPEDGEYKAPLTDLLVSLKTRLLLNALNKHDHSQPLSQLLDTVFPVNIDESLKQRSGDILLNADEEALVARVRERREQLVQSAADESIKKTLEDASAPENFAESLSIFLQSHLAIVVDYAEKYGVNIPLNEDDTAISQDPNGAQHEEHDSLAALLQSATSHLAQAEGDHGQGKDALSNGTGSNGVAKQLGSAENDDLDLKKLIEESLSTHLPELKEPAANQPSSTGLPDFDSKNLASLISEKLKSELDIPTHGLPNLSASAHSPNTATNSQSMIHPVYQAYMQASPSMGSMGTGGDVLPPNQSMPTAALYEKARQAAVAKSSNTTRREGLHSTRRPWTPEEEKALMAGLDMVKGPHWSQILSLFGQNGTISDILKDRTQVQLKDKARNLKLFFLKTNSEMPYYLQSVTGELKTRAPGQAARKEAEEKARMNLEEEQARIQGIMTLASGLQNNHHPIGNTPIAPSPSKRTSPTTLGLGGTGVGTTTHAAHVTAGNGTTMPAMPGPPRIKTELSDQSSLPKVSAFPPIQPAPAPGTTVQQGRTPLPALQQQPGTQPQQPRPPTQQQYQQTQQFQQPRPQEVRKLSMPMPQQQQQQQRLPLPQHQPQVQQQPQPQLQLQPQAPPRTSSQTQQQQQPQSQQQRQAQPQPDPSRTPAQAQAQPQAIPQTPVAAQATGLPPPQQSLSQTQTQIQTQQQSQAPAPSSAPPPPPPPQSVSQPLPLAPPPIPPNHHSTPPDHDTKLFETLQAAIAASTAGESGTSPVSGNTAGASPAAATATATAVSEGSRG
ncbi:hypothetical protein N657DRAFT_483077 [Parathielavia appendiculata]|uniref:HTH myb-type domain-containing protein n=1 Tax=Parathielavia appendiculata TaxID=2587402 RepID=A0AAN6TY45_9PEZI|nr:hypothetical protein N657DRAFT_483077 [Parathielavia appendiculata]